MSELNIYMKDNELESYFTSTTIESEIIDDNNKKYILTPESLSKLLFEKSELSNELLGKIGKIVFNTNEITNN